MRAVLSPRSIAIVAGALAAGAACLPDLAPLGQSGPPAPAFCGDGIIEPDAGEECDPGDAASPGCTACKVACTGTLAFVDPVSEHCYFSAGFTQALDSTSSSGETTCEHLAAHVVRYVSDQEMALVASNVAFADIWVGLTRPSADAGYLAVPASTPEPGWSPACPGCYAYLDAGASLGAGTINCVVSEGTGAYWRGSLCSKLDQASDAGAFERQTVCEREPVGSRASPCPQASVCFTVAATQGSKRYVLIPQALSAGDAVAACTTYGGRLVELGSREEREQVAREVFDQVVTAPIGSYWIGLANGAWDAPPSPLAPSEVLGLGQAAAFAEDAGVDASVRAFVSIAPGTVDSELARAELDGGLHDPLCELAP